MKELPTSNEWSLKGLHAIATEIALAVKKEPPYDLIGGALRSAEGKSDESLTVEKKVRFQDPIKISRTPLFREPLTTTKPVWYG